MGVISFTAVVTRGGFSRACVSAALPSPSTHTLAGKKTTTTTTKRTHSVQTSGPEPNSYSTPGKDSQQYRKKKMKDVNIHQSSHPIFLKLGLVKPSHTNSSFHQSCVIVSLL